MIVKQNGVVNKMVMGVARGTSESGDLGMIVGDPLVARVKRDMPGVNVRGYPVQVRKEPDFVQTWLNGN
jgi:hypothetical protein